MEVYLKLFRWKGKFSQSIMLVSTSKFCKHDVWQARNYRLEGTRGICLLSSRGKTCFLHIFSYSWVRTPLREEWAQRQKTPFVLPYSSRAGLAPVKVISGQKMCPTSGFCLCICYILQKSSTPTEKADKNKHWMIQYIISVNTARYLNR